MTLFILTIKYETQYWVY